MFNASSRENSPKLVLALMTHSPGVLIRSAFLFVVALQPRRKKKKELTEADRAMEKAEKSRKRKHQNEKKLEDEVNEIRTSNDSILH